MPEYSKYQQGIIRRFYENRDTLALQKLGETVSNLYLEESEAKLKRAWKSVHTQLLHAGVHEHHAKQLVDNRDLDGLAKIVNELS